MNDKEYYSSEEIAKIELLIRKNIKDGILLLDDLILAKRNKESLTKLKEATVELNGIENKINDDSFDVEKWKTNFQKQVREAVDRAKSK